jgi:hypothetical protein
MTSDRLFTLLATTVSHGDTAWFEDLYDRLPGIKTLFALAIAREGGVCSASSFQHRVCHEALDRR